MLVLAGCDWTQGWTEANSLGYWLKEAQAQSQLDKPGPGYWCKLRTHNLFPAVNVSIIFFATLLTVSTVGHDIKVTMLTWHAVFVVLSPGIF